MGYKLSKELKTAISNLPDTEKDKLLFKLLPKDKPLCEKLEFELLEEGATLEDRRQEIRGIIETIATGHHYSAGWLMMDMRSANAEIGRHTKRTNDKEGEIILTLELLNRVMEEQAEHFTHYTTRTRNLADYVAKRSSETLAKVKKLHPDLHIEFEPGFSALLQRIYSSAVKKPAEELQLPREFE